MWTLLATWFILFAPTFAQILAFGTGQLPLCAQTCTQLALAQAPCVSQPSVEQNCFCSSPYLTQQTNLFQTSDGICTSDCPQASDRTQIQTWFKNYCGNSAAAASSGGGSSAPAAATSTTASAPAATTSSFSGTPVNDNVSWWSGHARWIAMVIVLIVAFAIIAVLGVFLKRRHDRRVNRATTAPLPTGWGPNSDPHNYSGPVEKTSNSRAEEPPPASISIMEEGRKKSHRLSKKGRN